MPQDLDWRKWLDYTFRKKNYDWKIINLLEDVNMFWSLKLKVKTNPSILESGCSDEKNNKKKPTHQGQAILPVLHQTEIKWIGFFHWPQKRAYLTSSHSEKLQVTTVNLRSFQKVLINTLASWCLFYCKVLLFFPLSQHF